MFAFYCKCNEVNWNLASTFEAVRYKTCANNTNLYIIHNLKLLSIAVSFYK